MPYSIHEYWNVSVYSFAFIKCNNIQSACAVCPTNREKGVIIRPKRNSAALVLYFVHVTLAFHSIHSCCIVIIAYETHSSCSCLCVEFSRSALEWPRLMIAVMVISLNIGLCWGNRWTEIASSMLCIQTNVGFWQKDHCCCSVFTVQTFTQVHQKTFFPLQGRHNFSLANERQTTTPSST